MEALYASCAGLDVHKKTVVACVLRSADSALGLVQETRTFTTMTKGLEELADWLIDRAVSHVVMEATGVYWVRPLTMGGVALRATPE